MLQDVVPVEPEVLSRQCLGPLQDQLHHLFKVTKELEPGGSTYLLPVGILRGLISSLLKAAKKSSQAAPS